jgi:putative ABC transport system permease protein
LERLWKDIRFGLRTLLRHPATSGVALLALALGIGANTAIFSVINGLLLDPLPYPEPDGIVMVWESNPSAGFPRFSVAPPNLGDWRKQNQVFSGLSALSEQQMNMTGGDEPEVVRAEQVSPEFFSILKVKPALGRDFLPEEASPGRGQVAILSHGFWQRRFGSDPNIVNRTLTLDGQAYTVIGVAPEELTFPPERDLYVPLTMNLYEPPRGAHFLAVMGRLKDGVSLDKAQTEMKTIASRLESQYPDTNTGWTTDVVRLRDLLVENTRPRLLLLMAAVAVVLLIACANVANLLLARIAAREREIAVRAAVGADRGRLVGQMITETVILFVSGGLLGLLLAFWAIPALLRLNPDALPKGVDIGIDGVVLAFTFGIAVLTGLVCGLVPAFSAVGGRLYEALKEGGRGNAAGRQGKALRYSLVLVEVALALILLVCAGLLIRSLNRLEKVDLGLQPQGILTMNLALPQNKYPDPPRQGIFVWNLMGKLEEVPGIDKAATIYPLPLGGDGFVLALRVQGRPAPPPNQEPTANIRVVSPNYFETVGIKLLQGRFFTKQDDYRSMPAVIVNQTMADKIWPGESALGKQITFDEGPEAQWLNVIGVVGDVRHANLGQEPGNEAYRPHYQMPMPQMTLVVKAKGDPQALTGPVREAIRSLDADQPVNQVRTFEEVVSTATAQSRFSAVLWSIFAGVALILASVGVYGVISYSVAQRSHEIGVRMALGARRGQVLGMVVKQGMTLVGAGVVIGLLGAWFAAKLLESQVYGVSTSDPLTYAVVPLVLLLVALIANLLPARRATRVDPLESMRYE